MESRDTDPTALRRDFRVGDFLVRPSLKVVAPFGVDSAAFPGHRIPDKAMAVLQLLAARPKEVCGRDFLLDRVWGPDRDAFDRVLDNAVHDVRRAFGDDARSPRYVQTVPKRGYRLIAPVEHLVGEPAPTAEARRAPGTSRPGVDAGPDGAAGAHAAPAGEPRSRSLLDAPMAGARRLGLYGVLAFLLAAAGVWNLGLREGPDVRVAVGQLANHTADPRYDDVADRLLYGLSLNQTPWTIVSYSPRIRRLPFLAGTLVDGGVGRDGGDLVVWVRVTGMPSGELLSLQERGPEGRGHHRLVSRLSRRIRLRLDLEVCELTGRGTAVARHCLRAARELLAQRRLARAVELLEAAVEADPARVEVYPLLAHAHDLAGRSDRARDAVRRGLERCDEGSPVHARLELRRAQVERRVQDERDHLERLRALEPNDERWLLELARFHLVHRRDCERSLRFYDDVLDLADVDHHHGLAGRARLACGDLRGATAALETYVERRPHSPDAWDLRALADRLTGRYERARQALNRASRLDPGYPPAVLQRARLEMQVGDLDEADVHLRRYLDAAPGPSGVAAGKTGRAQVALARGDLERAAAYAAEVLDELGDVVPALWVAGLVQIATGDPEAAEDLASRMRQAIPAGSRRQLELVHHLRAQVLLARADAASVPAQAEQACARALEALDQALELRPVERGVFLYARAEGRRRCGRADAADAYRRVLAFNPDHAGALCRLARLHGDAGRPRRALELRRRAAEVSMGAAEGCDDDGSA